MRFKTGSHNFGRELIIEVHPKLWEQIKRALSSISEDQIKVSFRRSKHATSISRVLNRLIYDAMKSRKWIPESAIFNDPRYRNKRWRLDFSKEDKRGGVAVEVTFNHSEAIAWNLIKPVLSSQLNHVQKDIQTDIGVIITLTEAMRDSGGFDSAATTFEKLERYLVPLSSMLAVPLLIVGLKPPESFKIKHQLVGRKKVGRLVALSRLRTQRTSKKRGRKIQK